MTADTAAPSLREALTDIATISACVSVVANPKTHVSMLANINTLATAALKEIAATPTPTEARERIARIIDPNFVSDFEEMLDEKGAEDERGVRWQAWLAGDRWQRNLAKADAILALLPDAATIRAAAFEEAAASPRDGIYIASKTKHADKWKRLRDQGIPIISTWIDEAGVGETSDFNDLWRRCLTESSTCSALVSYREPGEVLKGGWVEIGAALANGVPVYAVGLEEFTIAAYCGITHFSSIEVAIAAALRDAGRK